MGGAAAWAGAKAVRPPGRVMDFDKVVAKRNAHSDPGLTVVSSLQDECCIAN